MDNSVQQNYLTFYANPARGRTFGEQGAIQVAGTATSLIMGISFGIIAGLIMSAFYNYLPEEFYNDHFHFQQLGL